MSSEYNVHKIPSFDASDVNSLEDALKLIEYPRGKFTRDARLGPKTLRNIIEDKTPIREHIAQRIIMNLEPYFGRNSLTFKKLGIKIIPIEEYTNVETKDI